MPARDDELADEVDELEEEVGVGPANADPDEPDPGESSTDGSDAAHSDSDTRTAEDAGPGEPTD